MATAAGTLADRPRWERGHRCHGYWLDGKRLGVVGYGPGRGAAAESGYTWRTDLGDWHRRPDGHASTLEQAKRNVEKEVAAWLRANKYS